MRRLVAVLLLALFSLQSSWAVAAAYCEHETRDCAAHFGHHADAQASPATPADDGGTAGVTGNHCHHCHAGAAYLVVPVVHAPLNLPDLAPLHALGVRLPAPPVLPLERPNWPTLA